MKSHKRWKNFIKEKKYADISKGKGQWTDIDKSDLQGQENIDLSMELYDLIATAYAPIGGNFDFQSPEDIPGKHDIWTAVDVDGDDTPDALRVGKNKPAGKKLTASGHDGSKAGKDAYIAKTAQMLQTSGHYAEMSKGIAHLMIKYYQVPHVDNEEKVRKVLGKDIEWLGPHPEGRYPDYNGWYIRDISGHRELKIMLGNPN
tara:strand:+ start:2630 stop:3235 length:606 start_codon:yes stop_codon:yes gene_type:complete